MGANAQHAATVCCERGQRVLKTQQKNIIWARHAKAMRKSFLLTPSSHGGNSCQGDRSNGDAIATKR